VVITNGAPLPDSGQVNECTGCEVAAMIAGWEFAASEEVAAALRGAFSENPQTGTWVLKPPGWSPNVGMIGGIGVLGVLGTMAAGCFESGACEAAALAL
jgi:hypothetical protein